MRTLLLILIGLGTIAKTSIAASLTFPIGCQSEKPDAPFILAPGSIFYLYPDTCYQIKTFPSEPPCFVVILQEDLSGEISRVLPSHDECVEAPPSLRKIFFWTSTQKDEAQKVESQLSEIRRIREVYKHQLRMMLEQETLKEMIQAKCSVIVFKSDSLQE